MNGTVVEGVCVREDAARKWLVPLQRRIVHALHHMRLLSLVTENPPCCLILVDECKFRTGLIEQNLVDHTIGSSRVYNGSVQDDEPQTNHDG